MPPERDPRSDIEKLERRYAEHPEGRMFAHLADAYRKTGELEQAERLILQGLERHPDYLSAHIVLGRVYVDAGQFDEAQERFKIVLDMDPENLIAIKALGDMALAQGSIAEARQWYERMLQVDPYSEEAQVTLERMATDPARAVGDRGPLAAGDDGDDDAAAIAEPGAIEGSGRDESEPVDRTASIEEAGAVDATEGDGATPGTEEIAGVAAGEAHPDWDWGAEDDSERAEVEPPDERSGVGDEGSSGPLAMDAPEEAGSDAADDWPWGSELEESASEPEAAAETGQDDAEMGGASGPGEGIQPPAGWMPAPEADRTAGSDLPSQIEGSPDELPWERILDFADEGGAVEADSMEAAEEVWPEDADTEEANGEDAHDELARAEETGGGAIESGPEAARADADLDLDIEGIDQWRAGLSGDEPAGAQFDTDELLGSGAEAEEGLMTETMAELYARQGLLSEALRIYRELSAVRPHDQNIRERIRALEHQMAGDEEGQEPAAFEEAGAEEWGAADGLVPVGDSGSDGDGSASDDGGEEEYGTPSTDGFRFERRAPTSEDLAVADPFAASFEHSGEAAPPALREEEAAAVAAHDPASDEEAVEYEIGTLGSEREEIELEAESAAEWDESSMGALDEESFVAAEEEMSGAFIGGEDAFAGVVEDEGPTVEPSLAESIRSYLLRLVRFDPEDARGRATAGPPAEPGPPGDETGGAQAGTSGEASEDLEQFQEWLRSLKR